jgi:hypothetical protein
MDHVVILDAEANEMDDLRTGRKSMIIHGSDSATAPYGLVEPGDVVYFVDNRTRKEVLLKATVSSVFNSLKLTEEESYSTIIKNQDRLQLHDSIFYKWAGKKYLVLASLDNIVQVDSLFIDLKNSEIHRDWFRTGKIDNFIIQNRMSA